MTKKYNQLTLAQRYKIEALIKVGKSQSEIAQIIGVHKSTIHRELKRNIPARGVGAKIYGAQKAQTKTDNRHKFKTKRIRFTEPLKKQMLKWMEEKRFSPELVAAQWSKENKPGVCHETIYKFIWHCKHTNQRINKPYKKLYTKLKHGKRRRKRGNYKDSRGIIPNRVSIENRPKIVENRSRFGDIEADIIVGANHKSALLITTDRATIKTTIDKLKGRDAEQVSKIIIARMKKMPPIKTMTFDNDQAFSKHEQIAKALNIKTYFTRPYTSQDKGTIENRNGVISLFFPKKTDFDKVSSSEIKRVEKEINSRPVRKFGYLTPDEVFLKLKGSVALMN